MTQLDEAIAAIRKAEDEALALVMDAIAAVAVRDGIDRMTFALYTTLYRDGQEVENEEIQALEEKYCNEVHSTGFQALWSKEGGWT